MDQKDIPVTSKVKLYKGRPQLFINDKLVETDSYLTYIDENNDYDGFNEIGFNLFSTSIFHHSRSINENTKLEPFATGVLDKKESIKIIDKKIGLILNKNPNAFIFPRINVELSKEWELDNEDELNDIGLNNGDHRVCLSSRKWIEEVKKELKIVITYIQEQSFAKNIIGYQIAGSMTEEWMAFEYNGSQGKRSRELFLEEVKKNRYQNNEHDYHKFLNVQITNVISELAAYIKELTDHRLIVGSFYGYTYCLTSWGFGHSALANLLECKDIDFICSPLSYWLGREVGKPCPYMSPVSSILLHNKMYFAENDTRTSLSVFYSANKNYHTPIWKGPNEEYSIEMLKYHYSKALTHLHSYWWFDLWGGWYKNNTYHNLFKKLLKISRNNLECENKSLNQVAVISDEDESMNDTSFGNSTKVRRDSLKNIESSGVSVDLYLASDFESIKDSYKCYIVLVYKGTNKLDNIVNYLKEHGNHYLIINLDNHDITSEEIRSFYKKNDIKTYDFDIVVDENNNYLSLYGITDGIISNSDTRLFDLLEEKEVQFPLIIRKGHSYLFKKI